MIKFKIFKGEKDESTMVFIQQDEGERKKLVFDVLEQFSFDLLKKAVHNEDTKYEIETSDSSMDTYKEIVKSVFDSVIKDEELIELYKEVNQQSKEESDV